jgi:hypothetical protein
MWLKNRHGQYFNMDRMVQLTRGPHQIQGNTGAGVVSIQDYAAGQSSDDDMQAIEDAMDAQSGFLDLAAVGAAARKKAPKS